MRRPGCIVNARFAVMCAHYLFDPDFCNVASGWEKGVVEKNVQDRRRRIWIDATKQRFGSFVELNAWLGERCRALWQEIRHPEHDQFSVAEMIEHERPHLMSMPAPFDGYVEKPARASSTRARLNFGGQKRASDAAFRPEMPLSPKQSLAGLVGKGHTSGARADFRLGRAPENEVAVTASAALARSCSASIRIGGQNESDHRGDVAGEGSGPRQARSLPVVGPSCLWTYSLS